MDTTIVYRGYIGIMENKWKLLSYIGIWGCNIDGKQAQNVCFCRISIALVMW